ncbi:NAD-dependent deacylase [bacterium]|nr:NAD-dependent deacylase [candidate division CSSED10-310 bacterium]
MKWFRRENGEEDELDLSAVKRVLLISGAGISQESDIPTFRDQDGLWSHYDPAEFATAEAITNNLNRVWAFVDALRLEMAAAEPNAAHLVTARLEQFYDVVVCTQNIDGLHQKAGSSNVIEVHGNAFRARCDTCERRWPLPAAPLFGEEDYRTFSPPTDLLPRCDVCGRSARPDVVLFNERYGEEMQAVTEALRKGVYLVVIVGTSGGVPTPYYIGLDAYRRYFCPVIDINPSETLNDGFHLFPIALRLNKRATEGMQVVWDLLARARRNGAVR